MVMTSEEVKELEEIKQKNKEKIMDLQDSSASEEHQRKMERLNKLLEIAKAGMKSVEGI